ncbi:MFS domain-containing protein [Aphelenchoides bicaudatus]|nr:MFS domain-containing protein [Aphelenchoides bicaudatus]
MFWKRQKIVPERKLTEVSVIGSSAKLKTPWKSIFVVSCFTFCTAAQFTLYFSSLWPFLQIIDSSASEMFYGVIIASYSLGQIISGPVVGWWSTKTKSVVSPAQACLLLTLTGNIIYITASVLPSNQKWYILIGRFFVGLGESSLSLYQGFTSTASTHEDRSKGAIYNNRRPGA